MKLIDADALKLSHCKECTLYPDRCLGDECDWDSIAHIDMMPTVDAIPVDWIESKINHLDDQIIDLDPDDVDAILELRTKVEALIELVDEWKLREEG